MRKFRTTLALGLCFTLAAGMSGCGLIPKEEELPTAPYLVEAETQEYVFTPVFVGDVVVTENIRSYYIPSANEKLSFDIGGEYIKNVYVELGDQVHAGDVLMELDVTNIESQITQQEQELSDLSRQINNLTVNKGLALEEAELLDAQAAEMGTPGWISKVETVNATYTTQINALWNTYSVSDTRLKELKEEMASRQLIASFDGVVTSLTWMGDHYRTEKGETLIEISDMSGAMFEVFSSNGDVLEDGKTYQMTCNNETYEVIAHLGSELEKEDVDPDTFYLEMTTPDPTIEKNDIGYVRVVMEQSLNTLYVKSSAIKLVNGTYVVYVLGEDGYREAKEVVVGLTDGTITEIKSGVEEGEYLILP